MSNILYNKIIRILLITFLFYSFGLAYFNNDLEFEKIILEPGFASLSINAIEQDQDGIMWFGTNRGLFYYSGDNFKKFIYLYDDSTSIGHSYITSLLTDKNNDMWVGTKRGLNRYENKTGKIIRYKQHADDHIIDMTKDKYGNIYFLLNSMELWKVKSGTNHLFLLNKWKTKKDDRHTERKSNGELKISQDNYLYIQIYEKFYRNNLVDNIFKECPIEFEKGTTIFSFCSGHNNSLWFGCGNNKFYEYNIKSKKLIKYFNGFILENYDVNDPKNHLLFTNCLTCINDINEQYLLLGNSNIGFSIFNKETGEFRNSKEPRDRISGLDYNYISNIFVDKDRVIWLGTIGNGLYKNKSWNQISNYTLPSERERKNYSITEDRQGNIWVGTDTLLIKYYNNKFIKFNPFEQCKINPGKIKKILEDKDSNIWLATNKGLIFFNPYQEKFKYYENNNYHIENASYENIRKKRFSNLINNFFEDESGKFWLGTARGLFKFNKETTEFQEFPLPDSLFIVKSGNNSNIFLVSIIQDHSGLLWLGYLANGMVLFDPVKECFLKNFPLRRTSSTNGGLRFVDTYCDRKGNIWAGSRYEGLYKFNKMGQLEKSYHDLDGLSSNRIVGITEDFNDNIWIQTNLGITRLDPEKEIFSNYSGEDGFNITAPGFSYGTILTGRDGKINVTGVGGIYSFDPKLFNKKIDSEIKLFDFKIFGKKQNLWNLYNINGEIEISYQDYIFSFNFLLINYLDSKKNTYEFFLEGYDKEWQYFNTQHSVTYTNIKPGHYVMRARGANCFGVWSEKEAAVKLYIKPPFYQTKWFYLFVVILFVLIIFFIIKLRTARLISQKQKLIKEVEIQTKELNIKNKDLKEAHDKLEERVEERTQELATKNIELKKEVKEREKAQNALQKKEQVLRSHLYQQELIGSVALSFNTLENFDNKVNFALSESGKHLNLCCTYLFHNIIDGQYSKEKYQWVSQNNPSYFSKNGITFSEEESTNLKDTLLTGEPICASNIHELPIKLSKIFKTQKIKSVLIFPLMVFNEYFGFICFVECRKCRNWNKSEIDLVHTMSNIVSNAYARKKIEYYLKKSEKTARALLNSALDCSVLINKQGIILDANEAACSLAKLSQEKVVGQSVFDFKPNNFISEQRIQNIRNCLNQKRAILFRDKFDDKVFSNHIYPITDFEENITSIAIYSKDITDQIKIEKVLTDSKKNLEIQVQKQTNDLLQANKQLSMEIKTRIEAEDELINSERLKRESLKKLTLQLAHEIKNPLASINSSAQLVGSSSKFQNDSKIIRHMDVINRNVIICNKVIGELYDYTHQDGLFLKANSFNNIFGKIINYAKEKSEDKSLIKIITKSLDKDIQIYVDEFKLLQALKNIINNGFDAMESEGVLKIQALPIKNGSVTIEISDTGIGINKENLQKVFNPFYSTKPTGFGLGLSLVNEIIKVHKGEIKVESEINKGTRFLVTLPATKFANRQT